MVACNDGSILLSLYGGDIFLFISMIGLSAPLDFFSIVSSATYVIEDTELFHVRLIMMSTGKYYLALLLHRIESPR